MTQELCEGCGCYLDPCDTFVVSDSDGGQPEPYHLVRTGDSGRKRDPIMTEQNETETETEHTPPLALGAAMAVAMLERLDLCDNDNAAIRDAYAAREAIRDVLLAIGAGGTPGGAATLRWFRASHDVCKLLDLPGVDPTI